MPFCASVGDTVERGEVPRLAVRVPVLDAERRPDWAVEGDAGAEEERCEAGGGGGERGGVESRSLERGSVGIREVDVAADDGGHHELPVVVDGLPKGRMAGDGAEEVGSEADGAVDHGGSADGEGAVERGESAERGELASESSVTPVRETSELVADGNACDQDEGRVLRSETATDDVGSPGADDVVLAGSELGAVGRGGTSEGRDGSGGEGGLPAVVVELSAERPRGEVGGIGVAESLEDGRFRRTLTERVVGSGGAVGEDVEVVSHGIGVEFAVARCGESAVDEIGDDGLEFGLVGGEVRDESVGRGEDGGPMEFVEGVLSVVDDDGGAEGCHDAGSEDVGRLAASSRDAELGAAFAVGGGGGAEATDSLAGPGASGSGGSCDGSGEGLVALRNEATANMSPGVLGGGARAGEVRRSVPDGRERVEEARTSAVEVEEEAAGPAADVGGFLSLGARPFEERSSSEDARAGGSSHPAIDEGRLVGTSARQIAVGLTGELRVDDHLDIILGHRTIGSTFIEQGL